MPAIYHEGSWLGNATDPEVLVKDTVGWTGKNRVDISKTVASKSGTTITNLTTSGFTVTGDNVTYGASKTPLLLEVGMRYIASATLISNDGSGARMTVRDSANAIKAAAMFDEPGKYEFEFTYQEGYYFSVFATYEPAASGSVTVDNVMIRRTDITDPTYEPYHESVKEEIEQVYADNGVLGAKNLGRNNLQSQTSYGVTYTHNNDDSITLSGTETKGSDNNLPIDAPLTRFNRIGNVIFSFEISGFNKTAGEFAVGIYDGSNWVNFTSITKNGIIEVPINVGSSIFGSNSYVCIMSRKNFAGSMTIKYMVRFASDPDDTYQPYAMTNRELTENTFLKQGAISSSNDLNNIKEDGIYAITTAPTHSPESTAYCILIVKKYSGDQLIQVIHKHDVMYSRRYFSNSGSLQWSSWYKFTGTVVS